MTDTIRAPWTPGQVAALNAFQQEGGMHQFMCGALHASGRSPVLDATHSGWICPDPACDYRQDWAHTSMADPKASPTLREQYARALAAFDTSGFPWGTLTPGQVRTYEESADIVLAVRDTELERLRARIAELEAGEAADREEILWLMNHNDRNCVVVLERDRLSLALETADGLRAEVQRDRDQHAAVLTDVLSRFRAGDGGAPEAWATREDLDRWRSVVAPTVERPWWEQVAEVRTEAETWRRKAIRRSLDGGKNRRTLEAVNDLAAEEITARTEWGDGYRDAMRELREVLAAYRVEGQQ